MRRSGAEALCIAASLAFVRIALAEPPVLSPCDGLPAAVEALGSKSTIEAFGVDSAASLAVAAIAAPGDGGRSSLRFARGGDSPKVVKLAGRVFGLALAPDGGVAYAIVRTTDRKGAIRTVELVVVDLETARANVGSSLPVTARGLAIGAGGATLLVAARNEIRSFQLPSLASGPLYRALGDNVGVASLAGSSYVLLAQPSRVVLADLAASQDRDGLVLSQGAASPAPLTGMLASAGDAGPIAIAQGGAAWCVRADLPASTPPPPPPPPSEPPAMPLPKASTPEETPIPPPAQPGTISGIVAGPAVADVAAVVFLGPENVLHEAGRAVPDERGRFTSVALPTGTYRMVAAGIGGRVLICDPSFITIRVDSNGAVEAPVLKVLRAQ